MSDEADTTSEVAPYTPDTVMVRLAYLVATKDDYPGWTRKRARAEFDRWLDGEKAKAVADAEAQQAQIAAQEPAEATQGGSGNSRASGGLDGAAASPLDEVRDMFFGKDAP